MGLEGFLNAKVFVSILKLIRGPISQEAFIEASKKYSEDPGLGKKIDFNNAEHEASQMVFLTHFENGKFVLIK